MKTVGGVRYSLEAFHPATADQLGCKDGCSYTSDQLFCFESGGLPSTCEAITPATHSSKQAVILAFNEADAAQEEANEKAAYARKSAESVISRASIDISTCEQIVTSLSNIQETLGKQSRNLETEDKVNCTEVKTVINYITQLLTFDSSKYNITEALETTNNLKTLQSNQILEDCSDDETNVLTDLFLGAKQKGEEIVKTLKSERDELKKILDTSQTKTNCYDRCGEQTTVYSTLKASTKTSTSPKASTLSTTSSSTTTSTSISITSSTTTSAATSSWDSWSAWTSCSGRYRERVCQSADGLSDCLGEEKVIECPADPSGQSFMFLFPIIHITFFFFRFRTC